MAQEPVAVVEGVSASLGSMAASCHPWEKMGAPQCGMISYRGTSAELLMLLPIRSHVGDVDSRAGNKCATAHKKTGVRRAAKATVPDGATLAVPRHRPLSQVRAIEV